MNPQPTGAPNDREIALELNRAFIAQKRKRIELNRVRKLFYELNPELHDHPDRNAYLRSAIDSLVAQVKATIPKSKRSWDSTSIPPLPLWLQVVTQEALTFDPLAIAWVEELAFCTEIKNRAQLQDAVTINNFLINNRDLLEHTIPLRERSLQIFGDEKRLDRLVFGGGLFGGRLPLDARAARFVPLPIPHERTGRHYSPILIVENHHTYWSLCQWNSCLQTYSAVVWGGGNLVLKHTEGIALLVSELQAPSCHYFGDIDLRGLQILESLIILLARKHGILAFPAPFYKWLLEKGRRCPTDRLTERTSLQSMSNHLFRSRNSRRLPIYFWMRSAFLKRA